MALRRSQEGVSGKISTPYSMHACCAMLHTLKQSTWCGEHTQSPGTYLDIVCFIHNDDRIGPVYGAELRAAGRVDKVVVGHEDDVSGASKVTGQEVRAHLQMQGVMAHQQLRTVCSVPSIQAICDGVCHTISLEVDVCCDTVLRTLPPAQ